MITWRAVRLENNEDVPLMDGDEGVTIDTSGSGDETSSTLRVPRDSPIINNGVVCAVNNGGPEETVGPGQFTRINIGKLLFERGKLLGVFCDKKEDKPHKGQAL